MKRSPVTTVLFALAMSLCVQGLAEAQFRGAWLPDARTITAQIGASYSDTDDWFCGANLGHCTAGERGNLSDTIESENAQTSSLNFKVEVTPLEWLSLDAQLPFHDLNYEKFFGGGPDNSLTLDSRGVGDLRVGVRAGKRVGAWGFSGGYGIEFPTGDFDISANLIPVGQGTRNHELFLEVGRSLHPAPAYLEAGVLYRIREAFVNEFDVETDWGDEVHGRLGGGVNVAGPWWLKADLHGFKSGERTTNIPGEPSDQFRSSLALTPGVLYQLQGLGWLDAWLRFPLAGRNAPGDVSFGFAATAQLGMP